MHVMTDETVAVRVERLIPAPPDRVYRAWLDPELIRRWMAPGDFTVARVEVDERVGGHYRIWHATEAGVRGGFESEIVDLVAGERIVFRWGFVGPDRTAGPVYDSQPDDHATPGPGRRDPAHARPRAPRVAAGSTTGRRRQRRTRLGRRPREACPVRACRRLTAVSGRPEDLGPRLRKSGVLVPAAGTGSPKFARSPLACSGGSYGRGSRDTARRTARAPSDRPISVSSAAA
jgi:uncharacterized protein YndB with AHSA1/START domain